MTRKLRVGPVSGLVAALVLLGVGAWVGSALVTSPQEAALQAGPPPPSTITAAVEMRQVSQEVVVRGDAQPETIASALGVETPEGATIAVLSKPLPALGDEFAAGAQVAEVSGRPVIVLEGEVPQYRPLGVGVAGADVAQLQAALAGLGYSVNDPRGTFGESTWAAVQQLYGSNEATAPPSSMIPVGELLFLPSFPASVVEAKGKVGDSVTDSVLRLVAGAVRVSAPVPSAQRQLVERGAKVVLSSEVLGIDATGKVGEAITGSDGAPAVEFIPDEPLPARWAGQGVRVRVISASTAQEVLAVPVAALFMGGDGGAEVIVVTDAAAVPPQTTRLPVEVGVVGGGYAAVIPKDGSLNVGDLVLISGVTE